MPTDGDWNSEFIDEHFDEEEKQAIEISHISNKPNPYTGIGGGADTEDRVYLLSIMEALEYFEDNDDRIKTVMEYHQGWALRTQGMNARALSEVNTVGVAGGSNVGFDFDTGVCPAMKVDFGSNAFDDIFEEDQGGDLCVHEVLYVEKAGILLYMNPMIQGELSLPGHIIEIGYRAFVDCHDLIKIFWPGKRMKRKADSFVHCEKLELPESMLPKKK